MDSPEEEKGIQMPVSFDEVLSEMPPERRAKIARRAAEIEAEINLSELRRLRKLTQTRLSKKLKIGQEGVSRIEKRTDLYLSTLRSYVEGVGGKLSLIVEFPDASPVILSGLGMHEAASEPRARKNASKKVPSKEKAGAKSRLKSAPKSVQSASTPAGLSRPVAETR